MNVSAVGIPWYDRDDYPRIVAVMADGHVLPDTYDQWRQKAEGVERQAKRQGVLTVRAVIKPDEFVAWCADRRLKVDSHARSTFANEAAIAAVRK